MFHRLRSPKDRALASAIRQLPHVDRAPLGGLGALFERAERHALAGVLFDAYVAAGVNLDPDLVHTLAAREAARECDHAAHLAMLARIDGALATAGVTGVALKGALLAERLYPRPAARPTTDIDLLVDEVDLEPSTATLGTIGYVPTDDPSEEHFRTAHHHTHLVHPAAPDLELHYHAYRGFGRILRSRPLIDRSVAIRRFTHVRVLSPVDELVYLSTHAAAHRFMRMAWLYDVLLLVRQLDEHQLTTAMAEAHEVGMSRPLALCLDLVTELFGWQAPVSGDALEHRRTLLTAITEEPAWPVARAATRFAYGLALCEDWAAAGAYARETLGYRWRHLKSHRG